MMIDPMIEGESEYHSDSEVTASFRPEGEVK